MTEVEAAVHVVSTMMALMDFIEHLIRVSCYVLPRDHDLLLQYPWRPDPSFYAKVFLSSALIAHLLLQCCICLGI